MNTARDRSVKSELSLHLVDALDAVIIINVIYSVLDSPTVTCLTFSRRRPSAITANINWAAEAILQVVSDILHARRVVETNLMGILVNKSRVATVT